MVTYPNAVGNLYDSGFYSGRQGALYKFAEPEVGWEAFISGKPGQEERNRGIALDAYKRLGGMMDAPTVINNQQYHYHSTPIREQDP
jgi:hypothetical protein